MNENYDFITMSREPQNLQEVVDRLFRSAQRIEDSRISSKIGEIKGLYSAYELSNSKEILETICKKMGDIILDLIVRENRRISVVSSPIRRRVVGVRDDDWFDEFEDYLRNFVSVEDGARELSDSTIGIYLRAFRRVLHDEVCPWRDFDSLYGHIDELIIIYEKREKKDFTIIAVLKYFRDFARMYFNCKRDHYRIVIIEEEGERVLWRGFCSERYSIESFKRILRQVVEGRRLNNDKSNWKPVRLYDKQNNIIKQEG